MPIPHNVRVARNCLIVFGLIFLIDGLLQLIGNYTNWRLYLPSFFCAILCARIIQQTNGRGSQWEDVIILRQHKTPDALNKESEFDKSEKEI